MSYKVYAIAAALLLAAPVLVSAEEAETPAGRYAMTKTDEGFLRLDTTTGAVSVCHKKSAGWMCENVADERAAMESEIVRLADENARLRQRIATLEQGKSGDAQAGKDKSADRKTLEFELPNKQDMDKVMAFFEDALRRFKEMVDNLKEKPKKDGI